MKRRSAPVGPAVVGELGAGVDVELLADVEVGLRVGDAVVDPRELRVVHEVDAEHQDEVVGDDVLVEVGAGLADLEELVELGPRSSSAMSHLVVRSWIWGAGPVAAGRSGVDHAFQPIGWNDPKPIG